MGHLLLGAWSAQAPGLTSKNDEILRAANMVQTYADKRRIWVIDRCGERRFRAGPTKNPGNKLPERQGCVGGMG